MALGTSIQTLLADRSLGALAGSDTILSDPATTTAELASLGPVTNAVETVALAGGEPDGSSDPNPLAQPLAAPAVDTANAAVLDFHYQLEEVGHQNPAVNEPIHALTALGETVGLGYLGTTKPDGTTNLLTDTAAIPGAVLHGDPSAAIGTVLTDAGAVIAAADRLGESPLGLLGQGGGVIGNGGLLSPLTGALNGATDSIGQTGSGLPIVSGVLSGLTGTGDALGLGHLGDGGSSNLVNDVLALPGALVTGSGAAGLAGVIYGVGDAVGTLGDLGGIAGGVLAPTGGLFGAGSPLAPVADIANGTVLQLHASLEQVGHENPILNGPIHALTNLGETIGLGYLGTTNPAGASNLLTDVTTAPGALLAGDVSGALQPILADAGHVVGAATGLLGSVAAIPGSGAGNLLGAGSPIAPVIDAANGAVLQLHASLEQVGHENPVLNAPIHALTNLGETIGLGYLGTTNPAGATNLVTDLANTPAALVGGHGEAALGTIVSDLGHVTGATGTLLGSVSGLATGLPGGLGEGGGSNPLISAVLGPQTPVPLANLGLLAPTSNEPAHVVEANVGTAPAGSPPLLSLAALTGDSLPIPALSGLGADSLVGRLADTAVHAAPALADAQPQAGFDLAHLAPIDLAGILGPQAADHHAGATAPVLHGLI